MATKDLHFIAVCRFAGVLRRQYEPRLSCLSTAWKNLSEFHILASLLYTETAPTW